MQRVLTTERQHSCRRISTNSYPTDERTPDRGRQANRREGTTVGIPFLGESGAEEEIN